AGAVAVRAHRLHVCEQAAPLLVELEDAVERRAGAAQVERAADLVRVLADEREGEHYRPPFAASGAVRSASMAARASSRTSSATGAERPVSGCVSTPAPRSSSLAQSQSSSPSGSVPGSARGRVK